MLSASGCAEPSQTGNATVSLGDNTEFRIDGVSVSAPSASLRSGEAIELTPVGGERVEFPTSFEPSGDGVEVHVGSGAIVGPIELEFDRPNDALAPEGWIPVVLHRNPVGEWDTLVPTVLADRWAVTTTELSPFFPGWRSPLDWGSDLLDEATNWFTGRTDEPEICTDESRVGYEWANDSGPPADGTYHACIWSNPQPETGDERVEVVIKSNRDVFQWIDLPSQGPEYLWLEGSPDFVREWTAGVLGFDNRQRLLLGPGRTLTLGYTRPVGVAQRLIFNSHQDNLTALLSIAAQAIANSDTLGLVTLFAACLGIFDADFETPLGTDLEWAEIVSNCALDTAARSITELLNRGAARAILEGRAGLASKTISVADLDALGATARTLSALASVIRLAPLATRSVTLLNDTLANFVPGSGGFTVDLISAPQDLGVPEVSLANKAEVVCDQTKQPIAEIWASDGVPFEYTHVDGAWHGPADYVLMSTSCGVDVLGPASFLVRTDNAGPWTFEFTYISGSNISDGGDARDGSFADCGLPALRDALDAKYGVFEGDIEDVVDCDGRWVLMRVTNAFDDSERGFAALRATDGDWEWIAVNFGIQIFCTQLQESGVSDVPEWISARCADDAAPPD